MTAPSAAGSSHAGSVPALLDPGAVAKSLCVSRDHVFALMRSGELAYVRVGRFYRIAVEDLVAFVDAQRHHASQLATGLQTVQVRPRRVVASRASARGTAAS